MNHAEDGIEAVSHEAVPVTPVKVKVKDTPWFQWVGTGRWKGRQLSRRARIFETFEDPSYSNIAKYLSISMMLLILLVTICYILESETQCVKWVPNATANDKECVDSGVLYNTAALAVFTEIEFVSVIIFTLEYLIRFATCPWKDRGWLWFLINIHNIIDLLACAPYWVTYAIKKVDPNFNGAALGFVRVIRLVRVFRVFRMGKYSVGIQMFTGAIQKSTQPLSILLLLMALAIIITSAITFMLEAESTHLSVPCFETIPRTFWWSVTTMTTVGYGDCYPITFGGKVMAEVMTIASAIRRRRIESGCVDLLMAPVNIWMPTEYLPIRKTRKTRTSRITRTKPRAAPLKFGSTFLMAYVTQ